MNKESTAWRIQQNFESPIVVLCVPSGWPANNWRSLGRRDLVGMANEHFYLYVFYRSVDFVIFSLLLDEYASLLWPNLGGIAPQGGVQRL